MSDNKNQGPQYPADGGAKISGDPACSVAAQGTAGGLATCAPSQGIAAQGVLGRMATCATQPVNESVSALRPSSAHSRLRKLLSLDGKFP